MKQKLNLLMLSLLLIAMAGSFTSVALAQSDRPKITRSRKNADEKKAVKKAERKESRKAVKTAKKQQKKRTIDRDRSRKQRSVKVTKKKNTPARAQKAREDVRSRGRDDDGHNRNDNRNGRIDRRRDRDWDDGQRRDRDKKQRKKKKRDKKYRDQRHGHNDGRHYRIPARYHHHPYWKKHHRARKRYYREYGWSPFFYLNLSPILRFTTYTRPLIQGQTHIVFTKEYDSYDYRPGDPVGYSVHISFNGNVRVYDRYYDSAPVLSRQFYIHPGKMHRLERILNHGRYYNDGYLMHGNYGDDDHPGYATIAYRHSRYDRMRSVSLNLAAPQQHYPAYFVDFMEEIDELLYNEGYF